jgi:biotin transport system substrate-specific component
MLNIVTSKSNDRALSLIRVLHGLIILFLTSQVSIPLQPVAITLQTVGVMLIGLTFQRKEAIGAVTTYLLLGAIGMPIFANFSGGIYKLTGPAGGYYFGFLVSIAIMTTIRKYYTKETLLMLIANALIGTIVVFIFGISWLANLVGFEKAILGGLLPFIIPGFIKTIITATAVRYIKFGKIIK